MRAELGDLTIATPRDRDGKMRFKPVEVREGAPVDFIFDLGRTADTLK